MDTTQPPDRGTSQSIVVTDPVAFRFLAEDPAAAVVAQRVWLEGFECYVVEQWACSRTDPTLVITTFSGDPSHRLLVSVLSIPKNEKAWDKRLSLYHDALRKYGARPRESKLGTVMVTSLSSFPSSLTVIPVPDGDLSAHKERFYVNEALKRLNCSGRVGITISSPNAATAAKFYQQYRISEKVPLDDAVIEFVKMCQTALILFDKLDPDYADGLLCDMTEQAITDWWLEFGNEQYNIEPHDGILGPTTVAALLGMLIGARNRLNAYGAPIGKDVFDVESTKRGIAYFQKTHRMPRTRRFDRQTLTRLRKSTAKAASGDGWFVPRAVKSTMAELGGKGGEMVMDIVGARDKSSIADVETIDIDVFVQQVQGTKAKWLWQGKRKPAKITSTEPDLVTSKPGPRRSIEESGHDWSPLLPTSSLDSPSDALEERERNRLSKKPPADRNLAPKGQESGRGLGRIKDAVGLRHHTFKHNKDTHEKSDDDSGRNGLSRYRTVSPERPSQTGGSGDTDKNATSPESAFSPSTDAQFARVISETPGVETAALANPMYMEHLLPPSEGEKEVLSDSMPAETAPYSKLKSSVPTIGKSTYKGIDLDEVFANNKVVAGPSFRRRQSFDHLEQSERPRNEAYWPRHLSFSLAEEGLSTWEAATQEFSEHPSGVLTTEFDIEIARRLRRDLRGLEVDVAQWVDQEINGVHHLESILAEKQEALKSLYFAQSGEYQQLLRGSKDVTECEREQLAEAAKEIEVLGAKLEYEINALRGKVEDVESGVTEFERQVNYVEERVAILEKSMQPKESWSHWMMRVLRGPDKNT